MKYHLPLFVLAACLLGFYSASAQSGELRIKGEASAKAVPEMMSIRIPLQAKADTYEQCNETLMRTYNELTRALQKAGIDKQLIKSSRLQINQHYTWVDRERKPDGFTGDMSLHLKLPHTHDNLNRFTKAMTSESFNFGYQLNFELSEKQKSDLEETAIKAAVEDARSKASLLADELGVRIISIKEVIYGIDAQTNHPFMRSDNAKLSVEIEEIDLNPDAMEFQKNVTIIWSIAP